MNHSCWLTFSRALHGGLYVVMAAVAMPAFSQAIAVTTPRLPPRESGPSTTQQPATPQPATQQPYASEPATPQPYTPQTATPQPYAQTTQQPGLQAAGQAGAPAGAQAAAYPISPMQASAQSGMYPAQAPQAAAYGGSNVPAAMVTPERAAAGSCRVQPSPDRRTLTLVSGAEALARHHVPLGEFRSQQIVHSPDGRWAVVFAKLRGAAQFAALTIDLERCEMQRTIDIPVTGEDARFEGDEAVLRLSEGELRVGLRDGRVR